MSDLVEFLKARLDEDERVAGEACQGPWIVREWNEDTQFTVFSQRNARGGVEHVANTELHGIKWRQNRDHIARHDPARVLREVEAKRQIVELHQEGVSNDLPPDEEPTAEGIFCMVCTPVGEPPFYPCSTLRLLALSYDDHPDYHEAWHV